MEKLQEKIEKVIRTKLEKGCEETKLRSQEMMNGRIKIT